MLFINGVNKMLQDGDFSEEKQVVKQMFPVVWTMRKWSNIRLFLSWTTPDLKLVYVGATLKVGSFGMIFKFAFIYSWNFDTIVPVPNIHDYR